MSFILPRFDFRVDYATAHDMGRLRTSYEDAVLIAPEIAAFAVADGMGGHSAGEVAARIAVEEARAALSGRAAQKAVEHYLTHADLESRRQVFACLSEVFTRANDRVRAEALASSERQGMGATLDVVWLARDHAFVAHAGDGRVYLARARAVVQITQDHTPDAARRPSGGPGQAKPPHRPAITNGVGLGDTVVVDTAFVDVARGDRLLLCTDGVYGALDGEVELGALLRGGSPDAAARALVSRSAELGRDNATAVVVEFGERFVTRVNQDRGLDSADLDHARESPLLVDLPESVALSALAAAVEIEIQPGESVPRVVASDLVAYIVLEGVAEYPGSGRRVGPGALVYPESLVGVSGQSDPAIAAQTTRALRLRADDFAEVCRAPRLGAELYRRLAEHLARVGRG